MKKQLFKLMFMLLAVVGLSANVFAAAGDSATDPYIILSGAETTLKLTMESDQNTSAWNLYDGSDATTGASETVTAGGTKPDVTAKISWTENSSGAYYLEHTETRTATGSSTCSLTTVRGFHLFVVSFKVSVYASDAAGTKKTDGALYSCSPDQSAFTNVIGANTSVTAGTDLAATKGTSSNTTKMYVTLKVEADDSNLPTGSTNPFSTTAISSVKFDLAETSTSANTGDGYLINFNGASATSIPTTDITVTQHTDGGGLFVFPLEFNTRWNSSNDIIMGLKASNVKLLNSSSVVIGQESDTQAANDNESADQTIEARPSTGGISVQ